MERSQRGDHDAFAALVGGGLVHLDTAARLILRDPERAQDAVQEAFLRAWRNLPGLNDPDRFDAWLYRLLVRACYDELRRSRRRPIEIELAEIDVPSYADPSRSLEDRDEIERGFRRLDADQRVVVVLHFYLDLPLPEVASATGVPIGTVKSRLHRALAAMRMVLGAGVEIGNIAEEVAR